jgi:hypothetical protein
MRDLEAALFMSETRPGLEFDVDLAERARAVRTREDFVLFIEALMKDFNISGATWPNSDLGSFFAAMAAWCEDMEGFYANSREDLSLLPVWLELTEAALKQTRRRISRRSAILPIDHATPSVRSSLLHRCDDTASAS